VLFRSGLSLSRRLDPAARKVTKVATSPIIPHYVQCPYCAKTFKRTKLDTRLNEHKDRFGNRCYGRVGTIV